METTSPYGYAGSLRGTCPASAQTSNWHSETQISSLEQSELPPCRAIKQGMVIVNTWVFILRRYKWHIHAGSWSLVNCWREALTRDYIRCSWILMNAAIGLMDGLGLDGDCIRVIPRQKDEPVSTNSDSAVSIYWLPGHITSFCSHLMYTETLWNEAWNDPMEMVCPDTPSFCDHIWSRVELFSDL